MMIIEKTVNVIVALNCPAPAPNPMAITKNKYTNSSGSLMAALNLTIDSAPTRPNDRASENFTIVITIQVTVDNKMKISEKTTLLLKLLEYFT